MRVDNSVKYTSLILSLQATERLFIRQNKTKTLTFSQTSIYQLYSDIWCSVVLSKAARVGKISLKTLVKPISNVKVTENDPSI